MSLGFLDTNVVVRYLTGRPHDLFRQAASILDGPDSLLLTAGILAEIAYVLMRVYSFPRDAVVDALIDLLNKENISVHGLDPDLAVQALLMCRPSGRISIADALLWATARSTGATVVYSLDRSFPSDGIEVRTSA